MKRGRLQEAHKNFGDYFTFKCAAKYYTMHGYEMPISENRLASNTDKMIEAYVKLLAFNTEENFVIECYLGLLDEDIYKMRKEEMAGLIQEERVILVTSDNFYFDHENYQVCLSYAKLQIASDMVFSELYYDDQ